MNPQDFRTQKAKGIWKSYFHCPEKIGLNFRNYEFVIYPHDARKLQEDEFPKFARPCPTRPRHGFVESRVVHNNSDVLAVWNETLRADPLGELVLTEPLSAKWSGVATNAGVTWGMGNDGATGYSATVTIPAPGRKSHWNGFMMRDAPESTWGIEDTIYAELVEDNGTSRLVQLRDGPEQTAEVNFIPEPVTVTRVLRPIEVRRDLLAWEKLINEAQPGWVVDLYGSSLASHFAVHAVQKGIPVVTDTNVYLGKTLTPTKTKRPTLKADDYRYIADHSMTWLNNLDYIVPGDVTYSADLLAISNNWKPHVQGVLASAIATVQTQHMWDNAPHLMRFRAAAIPSLIRFLVSAVGGEMRHFRKEFEYPKTWKRSGYSGARTSYYMPVLQGHVPLNDMLEFLPQAAEAFTEEGQNSFGEEFWEDSFGGDGWAGIANSTVTLIETFGRFRTTPNKTTWERLVNVANEAVNVMHNNGRAAEKWISGNALDTINAAPVIGFINDFAARLALGLDPALDKEIFNG